MRVFVNGCDTYVGNAIGSALAVSAAADRNRSQMAPLPPSHELQWP